MRRPQSFPIDKIYVPVKRRKTLKPEVVQKLAESILEVGQEFPILVRLDQDRFVLVEGLHRLEACKALGETVIKGLLVSAQDIPQKAVAPYEAEAEARRQKTERLRKLRLEKEAGQQSEVASAALAPKQTGTVSKRGPIDSKPITLADWIESQKRDGSRY